MSDLFDSPEDLKRHNELLEKRLVELQRHHKTCEKWYRMYHEVNEFMVRHDDCNAEWLYEVMYEIDGGVYDEKLGALNE